LGSSSSSGGNGGEDEEGSEEGRRGDGDDDLPLKGTKLNGAAAIEALALDGARRRRDRISGIR
jgi:hypothetical protein